MWVNEKSSLVSSTKGRHKCLLKFNSREFASGLDSLLLQKRLICVCIGSFSALWLQQQRWHTSCLPLCKPVLREQRCSEKEVSCLCLTLQGPSLNTKHWIYHWLVEPVSLAHPTRALQLVLGLWVHVKQSLNTPSGGSAVPLAAPHPWYLLHFRGWMCLPRDYPGLHLSDFQDQFTPQSCQRKSWWSLFSPLIWVSKSNGKTEKNIQKYWLCVFFIYIHM